MIIDALLSILIAFLNGIIAFFSVQADVSLSNNFTQAISTVAGYYNATSFVVPYATIFAIIAFELTFETIFFIYKLVRWAYQKIPGVN